MTKAQIYSLFTTKAVILMMAVLSLSVSCEKERVSSENEAIVFGLSASENGTETKVSEVTSLSSFYASAVTGSAGSESSRWNSTLFTETSASTFTAEGRYWPGTNIGLKFYGSNVPLFYGAEGTYVNATNDTDVVCAYDANPTYKAKNSLTFNHIFARISTVTVSPTGADISNVTIWIVNAKTGGVYNLRTGYGQTDGTGWGDVQTTFNSDTELFSYAGSITNSSQRTGSNNQFYLVPGEYYFKACWTRSNDPSNVLWSVTNEPLEVVAGKINSYVCILSGEGNGLLLSTLDGIHWASASSFGVVTGNDFINWPTPSDFNLNPGDFINWANPSDVDVNPGDRIVWEKKYKDVSLINPFTGASMARETANCYVITEPGDYCLPLFYGNAVVNGSDNISTAAPAKVNANDGVFVNAYDVAISSGNIKTDLESTSKTLNTSGGKLIWSTKSATSNALVTVESEIVIKDGIGYLNFSVPSDRFQEGSALIGVLKSGSTTEYIWAWHIWITDGNVLETEEHTNHQGNVIDLLNRPLGGRGGTSLVNVYYQYGMPFPLPPSNGSGNTNAPLYDENGTYTFNYDSGNTISTLGKALSKPYLPRWNNGFFNDASGTAQNFYNMWDATQTAVNSDKAVVKTIYDPSPARMSVPRLNAFTGFTTTGQNVMSGAPTNCNVVGSFSQGWKFKKNSADATGSLWAASGSRFSGSAPAVVRSYGYCWSACPNSSAYGYNLNFYSSNVRPLNYNSRYYSFPVRPALIEN